MSERSLRVPKPAFLPQDLDDYELAILARVPPDFWRDLAAELIHADRVRADGKLGLEIHVRGGRVSTWTPEGLTRTCQPRKA